MRPQAWLIAAASVMLTQSWLVAGAKDCTRADVDRSNFFWWRFDLGTCEHLSLNNFTLGLSGATALTRALRNNKELKSLKLELCGIGPPGAVLLAGVLSSTALEVLDLDGNGIGFEGAVALAEAIPASSLHELDLESNSILDGGAIAVAEALRNRRSSPLKKLDLENNDIGDAGVATLAAALRKNGALEEIDLHGNFVGTRAMRAMVAALTVNRQVVTASLPEANLGLPLRTRRYLNTLSAMLEKLVEANEAGATVARKRAMLRRALKRFKARRRNGRRKG